MNADGRTASYNVTDGKFCHAFYHVSMNHYTVQQLCYRISDNDSYEKFDLDTDIAETIKINIHIIGGRRVIGGPFYDDTGEHVNSVACVVC